METASLLASRGSEEQSYPSDMYILLLLAAMVSLILYRICRRVFAASRFRKEGGQEKRPKNRG